MEGGRQACQDLDTAGSPGCSVGVVIPDLELKQLATRKHQQAQTKKPPNTALPDKGPGEGPPGRTGRDRGNRCPPARPHPPSQQGPGGPRLPSHPHLKRGDEDPPPRWVSRKSYEESGLWPPPAVPVEAWWGPELPRCPQNGSVSARQLKHRFK